MMETALVKGSEFEELLIKIKKEGEKEQEESLTSERNKKRRQDLLKSICSVYFFLRKVADMTRREMTLEEFEIAEAQLKKMAENAAKKIRHKIFGIVGFKTAWMHYHKFGYFHIKRTPFGNWWKFHGWIPNSSYECGFWLWNGFDPNSYVERNDYSLPPNAKELLNELFEKRFVARV